MAEDDTPPGTTVPAGASPSASGPSLTASDLPARAADFVDHALDQVNDRVIRPLVLAARGLVFGLLAATLGLVMLILFAVLVVRFLDDYAFSSRPWISEAAVGALFSGAGLFCWSRRQSRRARSD